MRWRPGYRNDPQYWLRSFQNAFAGGRGTRDQQVRWVQYALNRLLNQNVPVDGVMSGATRTAVRNFQQRSGLPVTGYVGPDTQQALLAATAQQLPGTDGPGPSVPSGLEPPADIGAPPPSDPQQAPSDAELFEFFTQGEFSDNEFESFSDHENWESELNSVNSRARGDCNCHHPQAGSAAYTSGAYNLGSEWEEENDKRPKKIDFAAEQVTGTVCEYHQTFTVDDYGPGAPHLSPKQQVVVEQIKREIRKRARTCKGIFRIQVIGHTSTGGDPKFNEDLGLLRAQVMLKALEPAIPPTTFATPSSMSNHQPLVNPDTTEWQKRRNRRVQIIML